MNLSLPIIALRNLLRRPLRTAFTAAGVAIGIGAIICIGGMSAGIETSWARGFEARGTDVVISGKGGGMDFAPFDEALKDQVAGIPGVVNATGILGQLLQLEDATSMVMVSGREWGGTGWANLKILEGRLPENATENAVVLGMTAADVLKKKVGDTLQIELQEFKVTGIADGGALIENGSVVVSLPLFQLATGNQNKLNYIHVGLKQPVQEAAARALCQEIERKFPAVSASLASETLSNNRGYRMVKAGSWSTSVLAMFVGVFSVMNTMLMSVFERTHEIGVLSAIGWKRRRIMLTIIMESIALSLVGYVTGVLLGLLALAGLVRTPMLKGLMDSHVGSDLLVTALICAVLVGIASSIYPAWKGANTSPAQALRA